MERIKLPKIRYISICILFSFCLCAGQQIAEEQVVPGVKHIRIYDDTIPWAIHVLEIDLTTPTVKLKAAKANNRLRGNETTSSQARRNQQDGLFVVAAVNADFYGLQGIPVGLQIIDRILLKEPSSSHPVFALTTAKTPVIEIVHLDGTLIFKNAAPLKINGINRARYQDDIILYNHYWGTNTGANIWGTEVAVRYLTPFGVGDTVQCVVTDIQYKQGNRAIPGSAGCVISAHGKAAKTLIKTVHIQDTLAIFVQLPPLNKPVQLALGGIPRIIRDGKISIEAEQEGIRPAFSTDRHPRTAIGYSRDGKQLFIMTVDGRQSGYSVGMTLEEVARFMKKRGCFQSLNLDGGGSTTMVINHQVVNQPSDPTGERAVANSLLILSSIPPAE